MVRAKHLTHQRQATINSLMAVVACFNIKLKTSLIILTLFPIPGKQEQFNEVNTKEILTDRIEHVLQNEKEYL